MKTPSAFLAFPYQSLVSTLCSRLQPELTDGKDSWEDLSLSQRKAYTAALPLRDLLLLKDHGRMSDDDISDQTERRFAKQVAAFGFTKPWTQKLMSSTGTIISGSIPLAMAFPGQVNPNDVDFITPPDLEMEVMRQCAELGYTEWLKWVQDDKGDEESADEGSDGVGSSSEDGQSEDGTTPESEGESVWDSEGSSAEDDEARWDVKDGEELDKGAAGDVKDPCGSGKDSREKPSDTEGPNKYKGLTAIKDVYELKNPTTGKTINIIVSATDSPVTPIPLYHSSLVMNYVTHHGFVMLHPLTTIEGIGYKNVYNNPEKAEKAYDKYTARGFLLTDNVRSLEAANQHECGVSFACPSTYHRLTDEGVLHIPFGRYRELRDSLEDVRHIEDGHNDEVEWTLIAGEACSSNASEKGGFVIARGLSMRYVAQSQSSSHQLTTVHSIKRCEGVELR
jgi:hypothetical protein